MNLFLFGMGCSNSFGQNLSLEFCYELANANYPLIKQKDLISKSSEYSISNISKGLMPQIALNGQVTYQSEVTKISIPIQGFSYTAPSKTQYKLYADISQPITDLFTVKSQKDLATKNAEISNQNIDVQLYQLRDRINQLYFGILMVDEQLKLNDLVIKDLESGKARVEAAIKNGVDYKSSLDKIKAQVINTNQQAIQLKSQRTAYADMLSYFINQPISQNTTLQIPTEIQFETTNTRPELKVFENRINTYLLQEKIIKNNNIPKVSLFVQAGAGQPSPLNMISSKFGPYALGGIRASWNIMNLYTQKNAKHLLQIDKQSNDLQKDIFLFNTNLTGKQQSNEIIKLKELIKTDDELVGLRNSVKNTSAVQLENGIITTNDYIKDVDAEDQSRQQKLLHKIQLLIAEYNLQNTFGNSNIK